MNLKDHFNYTTILLGVTLALAFAFSIVGIDNDLPYYAKHDESFFIKPAVKMALVNDYNPDWFGHPGSTLIYPLGLVYKGYMAICCGLYPWQKNDVFADAFSRPPRLLSTRQEAIDQKPTTGFETTDEFQTVAAQFYRIGRRLNLFIFLIGILLTYWLGKTIWNTEIGLSSAWFLAVTPFLIEKVQVVRTDHAGLVFYLLGLMACCRLATKQSFKDYAIAGLAIGLAGSTRYFNFSLGATLIAAHVLFSEPRQWKKLIIGLCSIGLGFILSTPAFIFSLPTVYKNLIHESRSAFVPLPYLDKVWLYLSNITPSVVGWQVWILALIGCGVIAFQFKRNKLAVLALFSFITYLLTISVPSLYWHHWIVQIVPLAYMFASLTIFSCLALIGKQRLGGYVYAAVFILIIAAVSYIPLKKVYHQTSQAALPQTRSLARQWIQANLPKHATIAEEDAVPLFHHKDYNFSYTWFLSRLAPFDEALIRRYRYFIANSNCYEWRIAYEGNNPEFIKEKAFYQSLFKLNMLAEFKSGDSVSGPTIRVYQSR
jgi:hypothetical protein